MRIGVVIPVRNMRPFIEEALQSIADQTYGDVYAYVADDRSDDGTYEWLKAHPSKYRKLKRNRKRLGWAGNLNAAAALAITHGCDAIIGLSADDILVPEAIETLAGLLVENDRDWVQCAVREWGGQNRIFTSKHDPVLADFKTWPPLNDKVLIRSPIWKAVGGYSTDISPPDSWGSAEDWDFWIKVFKAGYTNYKIIDDALYWYRIHETNLSWDRHNVHVYTVKRLREKYPEVWEMSGGWGHYGPYAPVFQEWA